MKPKFTDTHRYPVPYTPASATDITKTIKRERDRLKREEEERTQREELAYTAEAGQGGGA